MAKDPIDTSSWPTMASVQCGGDGCDQWILVDRTPGIEFTGTGRCTGCLHARIGMPAVTTVDPPAHWFREHNPLPPDPVYPPSVDPPAGVRLGDPDVSAACTGNPRTGRLDHGPLYPISLYSLDPADVAVAFGVHDHLWHRPRGWLIGGPGGADGDVCNPCGGGNKDKSRMEQPRHDLCLRGNPRGGWGRNCPCTHDRPYMRGIKPDQADGAPAVQTVRDRLAATRPEPTPPPVATAFYLFDPEEDPDA